MPEIGAPPLVDVSSYDHFFFPHQCIPTLYEEVLCIGANFVRSLFATIKYVCGPYVVWSLFSFGRL